MDLEAVYRHIPSDGRPCQLVCGAGKPITRDGLIRVGFIDDTGPDPSPQAWGSMQFEFVRPTDLVAA